MAWLGDLVLRLKAETADFQQDLGKAAHMAERSFKQINSAAASLGVGLSALGFGAMIKNAIDAADELNKLSQKLNLSVESLAGWRHAADLAGVSQEGFTKAVKSLSSQMFDAASGLAESKRNFGALGIEIQNTDGTLRSADTVMLEVADRFAQLNDGAGKSALSVKLFGKAGLDMIPMLNEGSGAIREMIEEGKRLNPVTAEAAKQAEIFNDNMTRLSGAVKSVGIAITNELVGPMASITDELVKAHSKGELWLGLLREAAKLFLVMGGVASRLPAMGGLNPFAALPESAYESGFAALIPPDPLQLGIMGGKTPKGPKGNLTIPDDTAIKAAKSAAEKAAKEAQRLREQMRKDDADSMDKWYQAQRESEYSFGQWKLAESKKREELINKSYMDNLEAMAKRIDERKDLDAQMGQMDLNERIKGTQEEARKAADMARALGMTFSSAFEDAVIKGKSLQDVLRGIADDLLRIALRQTVTEPIATGFSGLLKGLDFTKIFTGKSAPYTGLYQGQAIPEMAVGTDSVPRDGLAWLHKGEQVVPAGKSGGISINQTLSFGSDVNRATMIQWAAMIKEQTIAAVVDGNRRARYSFS